MKWGRTRIIALIGVVIWLIFDGPLGPYRKVIFSRKPPQMILVLGGDIDRERFGISLARELDLPLIVSGGSNPEHAMWLVKQSGIPLDQVKLDYRAKDTLGNFTSLVDDLQWQGIKHAFLVTSEDHFPRAMSIGNVVAGSREIRLTGISVSCADRCKKEGWQKRVSDLIRAITWVVTQRDLKVWAIKHWPNNFIFN